MSLICAVNVVNKEEDNKTLAYPFNPNEKKRRKKRIHEHTQAIAALFWFKNLTSFRVAISMWKILFLPFFVSLFPSFFFLFSPVYVFFYGSFQWGSFIMFLWSKAHNSGSLFAENILFERSLYTPTHIQYTRPHTHTCCKMQDMVPGFIERYKRASSIISILLVELCCEISLWLALCAIKEKDNYNNSY